jgi:hypothetical protein
MSEAVVIGPTYFHGIAELIRVLPRIRPTVILNLFYFQY